MDTRERLDALARDRRRGASEITADALAAYEALARDAEDPVEALADAGARLVAAHPAMAPLLNATDRALRALREDGPAGLAAVRADRRERSRAAAAHGADVVPEDGRVVVYSRSGTVLAALRRAREDGRAFHVVVSEARPGNEGVDAARSLAEAGTRVTVTTDADLFERAARADAVLVGADAICAAGLVNKTGTGALAREAARGGTPAYVLATSDKRLPTSHRRRPPLTTSGTLGHELPAGAREAAPLFACTPLAPFEAVVTEDGPTPPGDVLDALDALTLDPALAERL